MKTRLLLLTAACLTVLATPPCSLLAADEEAVPSPLDGTWTWDFTMPDGAIVSPKVTLRREGDKLTGVASFRPGSEVAITDGRVHGDDVSFAVERERDGRKVVTRYTGRFAGNTLRGKIESNWTGDTESFAWEATKPLIPPHSVWNSVLDLPGDQKQRWRMRFRQQGNTLSGSITTSSRTPLEVKDGKVEGDTVSFRIERKRGSETDLFAYRGTVSNNTIRGSALATLQATNKHTLAWVAERRPTVVDGKWEWTHGGAKRELTLKRDGEKLTGKFITDEKHEYVIEKGHIAGVEIYFEVERERDAEKTLTKFRGSIGDDRITGKTEFIMNDEAPIVADWEALKVEGSEPARDGGPRQGQGRGKGKGKGRGRN